MNVLQGRCHCGSFNVSYRTVYAASDVPARACDCAFCTRHGAYWSSDAKGVLRIEGRREYLREYRFGTQTADFLFCGRCASVLAAVCDIDHGRYAVVNLAVLQESACPRREDATRSSLGDETIEDRQARRARNWIPAVEIVLH